MTCPKCSQACDEPMATICCACLAAKERSTWRKCDPCVKRSGPANRRAWGKFGFTTSSQPHR